ncbi:MAG TPA: hypothetical protein VFL86_23655 [Burkholderiaceae bacterium]|nr:hypothetical protein [Burkholderiaceae bacterium]
MGVTRSERLRPEAEVSSAVASRQGAVGQKEELSHTLHASPRSAAQRQQIRSAFGPAMQRQPLQAGAATGLVLQPKVGFEFQMLTSEVTLANNGKDTEKVTWNGKNGWHLEKDGVNAEFVVKAVETPDQAETQVREVLAVANKVARTGTYADSNQRGVQPRSMTVKKTDTGAQPQLNTDVSPTNFLGGTTGYTGLNTAGRSTYFGVDLGAPFNWNPAKTKGSMDHTEAIKNQMRTYSDATIQNTHLQAGLGNIVAIANTEPSKLAKATLLARTYCVLEASIRETAPSNRGLTKDMPVLPKTNLRDIEREITTLLKDGLATAPRNGPDQNAPITFDLDAAFAPILADLQEASGSGRKNFDLFETTGGAVSGSRHVYGVKDAKNVSSRRNYSLLLEYRRIPVLPTGQWVAFARQAATDFGTLDQ